MGHVNKEQNLGVPSVGTKPTPDLRAYADREKWFVVTNGQQTDIHARVFPPNQESREIVIYSNATEDDARRTVNEHNAGLMERERDEREARDYEWERG